MIQHFSRNSKYLTELIFTTTNIYCSTFVFCIFTHIFSLMHATFKLIFKIILYFLNYLKTGYNRFFFKQENKNQMQGICHYYKVIYNSNWVLHRLFIDVIAMSNCSVITLIKFHCGQHYRAKKKSIVLQSTYHSS